MCVVHVCASFFLSNRPSLNVSRAVVAVMELSTDFGRARVWLTFVLKPSEQLAHEMVEAYQRRLCLFIPHYVRSVSESGIISSWTRLLYARRLV